MDRGDRQREQEHQKRVSDLREKMHKKVEYYAQKPVVEPTQLYHLVREFFMSLIEKDYEPTYQEIISELEELDHEFLFFTKSQRENVKKLLLDLSKSHYSNGQLSGEQTKNILSELKQVIGDLTTNSQGGIDHLLHVGLSALAKNDVVQAKDMYIQARNQVSSLDPDHQEQYRPELEELYKGLTH